MGLKVRFPLWKESVLFKIFGINAFALCITTKGKEEIIRLDFVKAIEPVFGAIKY